MESIIETLYINLSRPQAPDDPELEKTKEEYFKMCDIPGRVAPGVRQRGQNRLEPVERDHRARRSFSAFLIRRALQTRPQRLQHQAGAGAEGLIMLCTQFKDALAEKFF